MAENGAHGTDLIDRAEAAAQQADGVEVLQPLAILHIGLATGQVFAMARVDQADFDPRRCQDLEEWNPVNAGGLHGHGGHAAFLQPIPQLKEILGEGGEGAHGAGATAGWHRHVNLARTDVNAGGVKVENGELRGGGFCFWRIAFVTRSHTVPLVDG